MSQNFDLGPRYFFMLCRKFRKSVYTFFLKFHLIKIKPRPKSKKMRHASLEMNVVKVFLKFDMHIKKSKREIRVQKIKVKKVNF